MAIKLDPRTSPFREDLAAVSLKGQVKAPKYVSGERFQVGVSVLDMMSSIDGAGLSSQLLFGEAIDVFDVAGDWAWVQCLTDDYVGYVRASGLRARNVVTGRISSMIAQVYPAPNIKTQPVMNLPILSGINILDEAGDFVRITEGFVHKQHVGELPDHDFAGFCAFFMGLPYLWGGRSSFGLDCSALVQLGLQALGNECPRDSDLQEAVLGQCLSSRDELGRGDLVFWAGHVGVMEDEDTLLHANAHAMKVSRENLDGAIARIHRAEGKMPSSFKRLSGT